MSICFVSFAYLLSVLCACLPVGRVYHPEPACRRTGIIAECTKFCAKDAEMLREIISICCCEVLWKKECCLQSAPSPFGDSAGRTCLFMLNPDTPYQPKDPGDGSNDGNSKRDPDCYDGK